MRLFLVGPRACGKTTVGQLLARRFAATFHDTDQVLCASLGCDIATYVAEKGWDAFRDAETAALEEVIRATASQDIAIVSTGGGMVLKEKNRELMRQNGLCLYLQVPIPVLCARLERNLGAAQRPSLTGKGTLEEVESVVRKREPLYLDCAQLILDGTQAPGDICENILALLAQR